MSLDLRRDKNGQRRGGVRPGAGRKPKGDRPGSPHVKRAAVNPRHPQHVTMRVVPEVGWLRRRDTYRAVRRALATMIANHRTFRIVHVSLQNTHIHMLCEALNRAVLATGMQAFQISAAKHLNAAVSKRRGTQRRGQVFSDRYHAEPLSSVRQVRNALAYVLNNWRRHKDDKGAFVLFGGRLDPYASGLSFEGWRELLVQHDDSLPRDYEPPPVSPPSTWLLSQGWRRARPIKMSDVPGRRDRHMQD